MRAPGRHEEASSGARLSGRRQNGTSVPKDTTCNSPRKRYFERLDPTTAQKKRRLKGVYVQLIPCPKKQRIYARIYHRAYNADDNGQALNAEPNKTYSVHDGMWVYKRRVLIITHNGNRLRCSGPTHG